MEAGEVINNTSDYTYSYRSRVECKWHKINRTKPHDGTGVSRTLQRLVHVNTKIVHKTVTLPTLSHHKALRTRIKQATPGASNRLWQFGLQTIISPLLFNFALEYAIRKIQGNRLGLDMDDIPHILAYYQCLQQIYIWGQGEKLSAYPTWNSGTSGRWVETRTGVGVTATLR